ncbi:uncharacterized protein LOC143190838 isoform X4 [Rhynchophorus ferrugineus]|uniref:uncharacterized protein LOC143190838 isoform X4 n=1 Tax=Rhynchophorus ferrugineus TaxID=354439 RepID=UPI003FCEE20F
MLIKVCQVSLPSLPSPKVAAPRRSPSPLILRIPSEIKTRLQSLLRPRGTDERRERAGKTATSPAHPSLRRPLLVAAAATTVSPLPLRCARRRPPPLAPAARACTVALRGGSASRAAAAIGRERQRRRRPPPPPRRRVRCILKALVGAHLAMGSEHYCLRWNNHQANLLGVCAQLLRDERLVDVTLACADEGRCIRAHKVVLSACSAYFRALFVDHPARHPIVILKDVRFSDLRTLVEFMYKGEVRVEYAQLSRLLQTAESLKVKGLAEMTREYKPEPPEQTEPEELVNRRPPSVGTNDPTPPRNSPLAVPQQQQQPPPQQPPPPPPRQSPEPAPRPPSQNGSPEPPPPANSFGPPPPITTCRPSPPLNCEPLPGPSNMPPVQQVPLVRYSYNPNKNIYFKETVGLADRVLTSLKKEVDWGGGMDDKNSGGESSSDYSRLPHDSPVLDVEQHSGSSLERPPSSASSSRASTPGAPLLPFPLAGLLEAGLVPPLDGLGAAAFRCGACLAGFPSPWLLEQHAALQHLPGAVGPDKPFVCDQCGQSYRYRSAYVKHREQNHRARLPADKLFSCDVCGMQFRYLKSFKKHRLNHALERLHGTRRPSGDSTASVTPAGQVEQGSDQVSSSNEALLPQDEDNVLVTKVKSEPETDDTGGCEGASTMETEKPDVEQDDTIDSRVSGSLPTPAAELLRSDGTDAAALATLLRAEPNDSTDRQRERRFACPFCGKCVRSKENLKLHVRKHTGERPFVCLFCGRAFGGKSDLTRHLRIHTGERPYHCDMCGKCFARADYLSKHLTTHINTPR